MTLFVELPNIDAQSDFFDLPACSSTPCIALQSGSVLNRVGTPGQRSPGRAPTQAALQRRAA